MGSGRSRHIGAAGGRARETAVRPYRRTLALREAEAAALAQGFQYLGEVAVAGEHPDAALGRQQVGRKADPHGIDALLDLGPVARHEGNEAAPDAHVDWRLIGGDLPVWPDLGDIFRIIS